MIDPEPKQLEGKRALVTGGTRGIGREIAGALAGAGADVIVSGRDRAGVAGAVEQLEDAHDVRVRGLAADLRDGNEVERLADAAWRELEGLDVLVNNAGISHLEPVVDVSPDLWDEVMAVNLRAPAVLGSRIGGRMANARSGGSIINIASLAGQRALADHYAYGTSKAGLIMATKMLALELGPHGVRANALCPTVVLTDMGQRVWGEESKAAPMLARIPAGRFVTPSEVADAVLYLASDASVMVNGVDIAIDGGFGVA